MGIEAARLGMARAESEAALMARASAEARAARTERSRAPPRAVALAGPVVVGAADVVVGR